MYTGPVTAGATIVTSVALAAAQAVVEQQTQYNETIQRSAERKVETTNAKGSNVKGSNAKAAGANDSAKKSESQAVIGQVGSTVATPPQSANPSRGSRVDLRI